MTPSADLLSPRELAALMAAVATVALGYGMIIPMLPALLERALVGDEGALAWHVGLLGSVYMLALFLGAPICGWLSDRLGRRRLILFGLAVFVSALLAFTFAATLLNLYVGQILAGVAASAVIPASAAYVADTTPGPERPRRFATIGIAAAIGLLLGPALGAAFGEIDPTAMAGLASPFFVAMTVAASVWFTAWTLLKPFQKFSFVADTSVLVRGTATAPWLILVTLATFGLGTFEVGATLRGQQVLLLQPSTLAAAFMVCGVVMMIAQALVLTSRFSALIDRRMIPVGFLVMTSSLLLLANATGPRTLAAYVGLAAAGYALLTVSLTYEVSLGEGGHGRAFGQQTAMGSLGQALGSASTGFLFAGSPEIPFWISAGLLLLGAALAKLLGNRPQVIPGQLGEQP